MLDVGAGTGKLSRQLVETGARVVALEPIGAMRRELERLVPEAEAIDGTAEAIPLPEASVDAAIAAQAYHWFDPERALSELHRVLRPGGGRALVWNSRDREDPLQAAIEELLATVRREVVRHEERDPRADFERSPLFTPLEERRFRQVQPVTTAGLLDAIASRSYVAALADERREALLAEVREVAAGFPEPLSLAYVTEAFVSFRQTDRR